jgi:3-oxoacyl-[acyl-carrier-protein] synthase-1
MVAKQFIGSSKYDHAVVVGADVLSEFIVSGFNSLMALSDQPCRPYDKDRNGINLGEGAGAILFSARPEVFGVQQKVELTGAGSSNDANHISGPSRTGKELALAIDRALKMANINARDIDSISAHGTATIFNDEMEARAFNLAGLRQKPLYSLKGNFGHTLGAAGVIETIIAKHALDNNMIPGTKGFFLNGVPVEVNISKKTTSAQQRRILKTASGFGGCNAAIILEKKM